MQRFLNHLCDGFTLDIIWNWGGVHISGPLIRLFWRISSLKLASPPDARETVTKGNYKDNKDSCQHTELLWSQNTTKSYPLINLL